MSATSRTIVPRTDPVLTAVAASVEAFDAGLRELCVEMDAIRAASGGVGIAAPQVGVSLRLFLIDDRLPDGTRSPRYGDRRVESLAIANPEIVELGRKVEDGTEGCLSLPETTGTDGARYLVPRATWLSYRGRDLDGRPVAGKLEGFMARVFQHEHDHLEGHLVDRFPLAPTLEGGGA